jgi:hypothetical protein
MQEFVRKSGSEVDPDEIDAARRVSPEAFLRSRYGGDVWANRSGTSIRVNGVLRADRRRDGFWVSCDWHGGGIGDNLALVRRETGCGFVEAVETMGGIVAVAAHAERAAAVTKKPDRPRVPHPAAQDEGRACLRGRGISDGTIASAEDCGAVSYCRGAVVFLGRDHATPGSPVRLAALRYLEARQGPDGSPMTKRDLAGSDKTFPVLLPGGAEVCCIVEGGTNALAVRDLWQALHGVVPTVLATGGVGVRHWLETNPVARHVVASADEVVIVGENEISHDGASDPKKQERTDRLRAMLADDVATARAGQRPRLDFPPPGIKDAADWNVALATTPSIGYR